MRALSLLAVALLVVQGVKGMGDEYSLDHDGSSGILATPVMHSYTLYPQASDYASGTCVGYAYCFANWNPPVLTEPDVVCPAGYDITTNYGRPFCVQKSGICPNGYDLSNHENCCMVKVSDSCYPTWDSCDGNKKQGIFGSILAAAADINIGSICQGTPDYQHIVDNVQMEPVISGSHWYGDKQTDGTMVDSSNADAGYDMQAPTISDGSDNTTAAAGDVDYQIVPSGSLINLGGELLHVGPLQGSTDIATGVTRPGPRTNNTGTTGQTNRASAGVAASAAQQAALDKLKQQAAQQGTYVADQPRATPADLSNQQAALGRLQQQAAQQGTYIAGNQQGSNGNNGPIIPAPSPLLVPVAPPSSRLSIHTGSSSSSGSGYKKPSSSSSSTSWLPTSSSSNSRTGSTSSTVIKNGSSSSITLPKEGLLLTKMLLLLPKIKLGGMKAAGGLLAKKEVMASKLTKKADLLPKCFSKCCSQDADVVCTPAKETVNYAKPDFVCPPGCNYISNTGKCLCRPGNFSPCQPTDIVCSFADQPICAGSPEFFGIEACKFVGALQQHLPKVQCPS